MIGREIKTTLLIEAKLDPATLKKVGDAGKELQKALGVGEIAEEFQGVAKALKDIEKSLTSIKSKGLGQALSSATGGAIGGPGGAIGGNTGSRRATGAGGAGAAPTASLGARSLHGPPVSLQSFINRGIAPGARSPLGRDLYENFWAAQQVPQHAASAAASGVPLQQFIDQSGGGGGGGGGRAGRPADQRWWLNQIRGGGLGPTPTEGGARTGRTVPIGVLKARGSSAVRIGPGRSGVGADPGRAGMDALDTLDAKIARRHQFLPSVTQALGGFALSTAWAAHPDETSSGLAGRRAVIETHQYVDHQLSRRRAVMADARRRNPSLIPTRRPISSAAIWAGVGAGAALLGGAGKSIVTGAFQGAQGIAGMLGGLGAGGGLLGGAALGGALGGAGGFGFGAIPGAIGGGILGATMGGDLARTAGSMVQTVIGTAQQGIAQRRQFMAMGPMLTNRRSASGMQATAGRMASTLSFRGSNPFAQLYGMGGLGGDPSRASILGYEPSAAVKIAAEAMGAGGLPFSEKTIDAQRVAIEASRGWGLGAKTTGGFAYMTSRKRGWLAASRQNRSPRIAMDDFQAEASGLGMTRPEVHEAMNYGGAMGERFKQTGIGFNKSNFFGTARGVGGGYRGFQFAAGMQSYGSKLAAQGPQSPIDMFALMSMGNLGRGKGGISAGKLRETYMGMEEGTLGPGAAKRLISGAMNWGGGNKQLGLLFLNRVIRHMGIPFGHRLTGALGAKNPNLGEIEGALQEDIESMADAADRMSDPSVSKQTALAARTVAQGVRMTDDFVKFELAAKQLQESMENSSGWLVKLAKFIARVF